MSMDHYHSLPGIEGQGWGSGLFFDSDLQKNCDIDCWLCVVKVQVVGRVGEEAAWDGRRPPAGRDAVQSDSVHGDDARQQERGAPQGATSPRQMSHRPRMQPTT